MIFPKSYTLIFLFLFIALRMGAQQQKVKDTFPVHVLDSIVIRTSIKFDEPTFLPRIRSMGIYSGKKTNVVALDPAKGNQSTNLARTLFAQVPGLNIWEMDGAGTQLNIGSRGSDPHRSIEMNMRQNGYQINSDAFGYPETHYSPALEAVERVELVRGAAALEFGPQFGGMFNYQMKQGDSTRPLAFETEQTAGSHHFFNSYNSVGGTSGKWRYFAYYDHRSGEGWRNDAAFIYQSGYADIQYHFNNKGSVALQFSHMDYRQQTAGGLTDAQFGQDPRQARRTRNYFSPTITIPALLLHYQLSSRTRLEVLSHMLVGQRNSVQFLANPDVPDTVNKSLGTYNPRQVDRDYYKGFTTEAKLMHQYLLGGHAQSLLTGVRYFEQQTLRKQKGVGTTASDYDLSLVRNYGIDLDLHTSNYAAFVENLFQISSRLSVVPGVRYELIQSSLDGLINNRSFPIHYKGNRSFPLLGMGAQYQVSGATELYANISQAYRPYLYANITPADIVGRIDPNLRDSRGHDIDMGYRGSVKNLLRFDINGFYLFYGDRVGQVTVTDVSGAPYLYTTNVGNAVSEGVEAYFSLSLLKLLRPSYAEGNFRLHLFNSCSFTHARYTSGTISKAGVNTSLAGKCLENIPEWINRSGLAMQWKGVTALLNFSYVGKSYSDANNTVFSPSGATGIVPAYSLWDLNLNYRFLKDYYIGCNTNNLANTRYFTRRINMYPGPGILPGDGRCYYLTVGSKF